MVLIHSPADGHLGCFHFGAIMNNTAVNVCAQVSACGYMLLILSCARLGADLLSEVLTLCLTFELHLLFMLPQLLIFAPSGRSFCLTLNMLFLRVLSWVIFP